MSIFQETWTQMCRQCQTAGYLKRENIPDCYARASCLADLLEGTRQIHKVTHTLAQVFSPQLYAVAGGGWNNHYVLNCNNQIWEPILGHPCNPTDYLSALFGSKQAKSLRLTLHALYD